MARTNRKRAVRITQAAGDGGSAGLATYLRKGWSGLTVFGCTAAEIDTAISDTVKFTQAMTAKLVNHSATAAPRNNNAGMQRTRRAATPAPQARIRQRRTTTRAASQGADLNQAILAAMPDTGPIQQSKLVQTIQAKYPNRWKGNIIGAGLGRFLKAGTLVRQGGTGNKAVWALTRSQTTQQQAA